MSEIETAIDPEFMTVAEAARRLGIGERRAYRNAAKLSDSDRRASDTLSDSVGKTSDSRQTLIRLSALAAIVGVNTEIDSRTEDRQTPGQESPEVSDTAAKTVRQPSDSLSDTAIPSDQTDHAAIRRRRPTETKPKTVKMRTRNREIEDELRERLADMRQALQHERDSHTRAQQLHLGTMAELQEMRRRAAELEAANLKLIEALPTASVVDPAEIGETAPVDQNRNTTVSPTSDTERDDNDTRRVETPTEPSPGISETKRGFWSRLLQR